MNTTADRNKHFILINDLDLQGVALTPVGDYNLGDPNRLFTGVFDGSGHIIRNADINMPTTNYVGLFGYVYYNGQIHNLGVENVKMKGLIVSVVAWLGVVLDILEPATLLVWLLKTVQTVLLED